MTWSRAAASIGAIGLLIAVALFAAADPAGDLPSKSATVGQVGGTLASEQSTETTTPAAASSGSTPVAPSASVPTSAPVTSTPPPDQDRGQSSAAPNQHREVSVAGDVHEERVTVRLAIESRVGDVGTEDLSRLVFETLNDPAGWPRSGFGFVPDPASDLRLVLAEPHDVDELCRPLRTAGQFSCQNGPVVALNAARWRGATDSWDGTVEAYQRYLINHEVGHLIGQRHPASRCPVPGRPAAVMEQQTKGLEGCSGNGEPREWEIDYAARRPVKVGPPPDWQPPNPPNLEAP